MVTIPFWFIRYALPALALVLATVTILLVRAGMHGDDVVAPTLQPPPPPPRVAAERSRTRGVRASGYSVRSGDTLGTIAERFGTTVDQLLVLNPGVDPRALRVGQSLRVK